MAARDELVAAVAGRYAQGDRGERGRILDEFAAVTGYHRKHAMRLLRAGQVNQRCGTRPGRRVYDDAVREALIVPPQRPEVSGRRAEMVMGGVYLVPVEAEPRFHAQIRALAKEFAELGLDLEATGPWPAYNFVPGAIGAGW